MLSLMTSAQMAQARRSLQARGKRADHVAQDRPREENRRCVDPAHRGGELTARELGSPFGIILTAAKDGKLERPTWN